MKKGWSWIIILILFFSLLFYFTGFANASSNCLSDETICFQNETIEKQIGSYQMMDSNGRIIQSGHWRNSLDLFSILNACIHNWKPKQLSIPIGIKIGIGMQKLISLEMFATNFQEIK